MKLKELELYDIFEVDGHLLMVIRKYETEYKCINLNTLGFHSVYIEAEVKSIAHPFLQRAYAIMQQLGIGKDQIDIVKKGKPLTLIDDVKPGQFFIYLNEKYMMKAQENDTPISMKQVLDSDFFDDTLTSGIYVEVQE